MDDLIDDLEMLHRLLVAGLPDTYTVARELDEHTVARLPVVLFDTAGNDDEAVSNGPGLWDIGMVVSVIANSEPEAQDAARLVDKLIRSWDLPGNGWLPGEGGVTRAAREQKFDHLYHADTIGKDARQADASYRLLMRVL